MPSEAPTQPPAPKGALAGVKVLDFGWAIVGSLTGKFLADHGAEVIRVESASRPDMTRVDRRYSKSSQSNLDDKPWFAHFNTSKYSLSLDLKNPRSRDVLDRLIAWADVVNENFTPGTLQRLGLDYDYMTTINPDIIFISGSLFGQTGPLAEEWGIDGTGAAISGRLNLTGWPDRTPVTPSSGIYGDYIVPLMNATAVVAALAHREKTGLGQYMEASMFEVTAQEITPAVLDWQSNGRLEGRTGNRVANASPHGVFPCSGEDRWCAIAVFSDQEWADFVAALGKPDWAADSRFATLEARKANEDELERLVAEWTSARDPHEVMRYLQQYGVRASAVQGPADIIDNDPQLRERGFLQTVEHSVLGPFGHQVPPFRLSATPAQLRPAPNMGEHNEYICTELLGVSDSEYIDLLLEDVFR
ncbi:CaiB/BaiF CoA transferase family protein [Arthrobacter sp. MA-N2]|uniref:CaiB/BaiF CoA transferase family protein n=1 Tax=Arthrobacter sp. MA-N2 TaxID=1101188 RepID=UPI0004B938F4|nr:CoA transferase [Arthrobacter sp. MA-N2]